ncbi:hypothetical protein PG984_015779 [Apiospora sp. TS-2023a]
MGGNEADEDVAYSLNPKPWNKKAHTTKVASATTNSRSSSRLTALPMELQLEILSYVDVPGLLQLRRTSRLYRSVIITREYLVRRFAVGGDAPLKYCCLQCLTMPPVRFLLLAKDTRFNSSSSSIISCAEETLCHRCWRPRLGPPSDERRGGRDHMYSVDGRWPLGICSFCGWPLTGPDQPLRHPSCRARRLWLQVGWFVLGLVQFAGGSFGAVAGWSVYEDDLRIKIPSSINFGLLWISLITVTWRLGFERGWYKWPLALEFVQAVLWLPPVIANAQWECDPYLIVCDSFPKTSLVVYIVNL